MMQLLRQRLDREDEGFTLIELMVVVLIIAILIAIAIPTFLGARARAQDRASQSNLRNALTAEKTFYTDKQAYTATATDLSAIEPTLSYQAASPAATGNQVQVSVSAALDAVCLTAKSASGKDFSIKDVSSGATAGTYYYTTALGGTCDTTAGASSW
jgi:type IV pilus assembly protein PilA